MKIIKTEKQDNNNWILLQNYSSIWISRGTKCNLKHVNFPVSIDYISRMEIGRNKIALRAIYDNFLWKCLLRETTEAYNTSYDRYKIRAKFYHPRLPLSPIISRFSLCVTVNKSKYSKKKNDFPLSFINKTLLFVLNEKY